MRNIRNFILPLIVIAVSVCTNAQQPGSPNAPNPDQLRRHVTYLASDHLEGRRTGTPGANDAAHYIAGEFSQIGLRPAFQTIRNPRNRGEARSNYRQKFPYIAGVKLGAGNEISFVRDGSTTATQLRVGEDWMPIGFSSNSRIEKLSAVFVGYGITDSALKHDDYAGANVVGKIAIAFAAVPDEDNPHSQFQRFKDVRWKAVAARNAGAKALVLIVRSENFSEAHLARLHYDNSAGDAGLPVVVISRQAAQRLLSNTTAAPVQLDQLLQPQNRTPQITEGLAITLATDLIREEAGAYNIVGILDGTDPVLKKEVVVIGAHYDHLGRGGEGSLAAREGEIHHGADDNASGIAGLLELARSFSNSRPKPRRSIMFIAFSGEEEGLLGSSYYVNNPVVPLANTVAMINLDMIGRSKDKKLIIGGIGTAQEWRGLVDNANLSGTLVTTTNGASAHGSSSSSMPTMDTSSHSSKHFSLTLNEDGYGPSDHSSFYSKQVPVLFFWTGTHSDYHKPSDTAEKINYADETQILNMVTRIVRSLDASNKRPTYTVAKSESTGRATGFRVYLGTIPNYADSNDGLLLDGVRDDSPAAKAGLKAGDKIVQLAGRDVRNVYDYTYALGEMKAGQEYEVEVVRGTERLKLKLTPAARN